MKNSRRSNWTIVRVILLLLFIGSLAFAYYRRTHPQRESEDGRPGDLTLRVRSIPVTDDLALGTFAVAPKETHEVKITVDGTRMQNTRVVGHFSVENGPGIQVLVLDEAQYVQFRKDSKPGSFDYLSTKTKDGNMDISIPHAGMFYIIFDNSAEPSAAATVKANVTLRYETVQVDSGANPNKKQVQ
jgi:hypothetical protein